MNHSKWRKLPPPNLSYKIKEKRDSEKGNPGKYQVRLLYWMGSLKRMIKVRTERIKQMDKEKVEIEKEILKLKKEIKKRTEYQTELRNHITDIERELNLYRDYLKELNDYGDLYKKPSFFIKVKKNISGNEYYVGRVRYFQYKGSKRREKYHYFGNVLTINRKYGSGVPKEKLVEVVKAELIKELKERFEKQYF